MVRRLQAVGTDRKLRDVGGWCRRATVREVDEPEMVRRSGRFSSSDPAAVGRVDPLANH